MSLPSPAQRKVRRILIACIGNIFMGDDGFGVAVAQRLLRRKARLFPENIQVIDFGIRGFDLAYALLDDYDVLILVDAVSRGRPPGTLYVLEPDLAAMSSAKGIEAARMGMEVHSMDPLKVFAYARTLGAQPIRTLLVGCEPSGANGDEDYMDLLMGLSQPVQAAVDKAVEIINSLVKELLAVETT